MDQQERQRQVAEHLDAIRRLQSVEDPGDAGGRVAWPPQGYYLMWHVLVGLMLGLLAAAVSLLFNVIGAPLAGESPLQLIRVYLTFPMGAGALAATEGHVLTVGCILYLITGGLYGVLFHLVMSWYFPRARLLRRFIVLSLMGLGLWILNFYMILSWLQPALLGGRWIVTQIPPWVAAGTHLVFAWTILLIESWGRFDPAGHRP